MPYSIVLKINENAVRLDDIDKRWHANEEDSLLFPYRRKGEYMGDYADIDLRTIHEEAQKYNDCCKVILSNCSYKYYVVSL